MLEITIPEFEVYDPRENLFSTFGPKTILLEHSLLSLSKWESLFKKPFLDDNLSLTTEELIGYVKAMTVTKNVPDILYMGLNDEIIEKVNDYINDPMSATKFYDFGERSVPRRGKTTSETIYWQMILYGIPFECQKWHLNRLLTLIRVCSLKAGSKKTIGKQATAQVYAELNRVRTEKMKTK